MIILINQLTLKDTTKQMTCFSTKNLADHMLTRCHQFIAVDNTGFLDIPLNCCLGSKMSKFKLN